MSFFNRLITFTLPALPKWIAKPFAKPYVAGETAEEALEHIKAINDRGFSATIDILGEQITDEDEARNITKQYCKLYNQISQQSLNCNLSIKPTHVGLRISLDEAIANITNILNQAKENKNLLRLDKENSPYTDHTFEIYARCKQNYEHVGVVIQSYLRRSQEDIERLASGNFNARICKGIYQESETIAFQDRKKIKDNFITLAKVMASKGAFAGFATHDQNLIDQLLDWINSENLSSDSFEFQVLYGVPMSGRLEALQDQGFKVRVYVPFGPDWFNYSVRRLRENPDIAGYVIKNMFKNE